jgi:DNA-binding transcriptional regulator LsrR (DeoR family)
MNRKTDPATDELMSTVLDLVIQGKTPTEIERKVRLIPRYGDFKRQRVYDLVREAGLRGLLRFRGARDDELERQLRETSQLKDVRVVRTHHWQDISEHVADLLLQLIKESSHKQSVGIGIAGGLMLMQTCKLLAQRLQREPAGLPKKLSIHTLVAGFDPGDATHSFCQYFADQDDLLKREEERKTRFVVLHAPGLVPMGRFNELKAWPVVKAAYDRSHEIDILVTSSGGHWNPGHSQLYKVLSRLDKTAVQQFRQAGVIGDLMWIPFSVERLDIHAELRTMTLFDLCDLPKLIAQGKKVVVAVGPCTECNEPKHDVLRTLLFQYGIERRQALMTHLVTDYHSARAVCGKTFG